MFDNFIKLCRGQGIRPETVFIVLGLDQRILSDWENGIDPEPEVRNAIAEYLSVTLRFLDTGRGDDGLTFLERNIVKEVKKLDKDFQLKVFDYVVTLSAASQVLGKDADDVRMLYRTGEHKGRGIETMY